MSTPPLRYVPLQPDDEPLASSLNDLAMQILTDPRVRVDREELLFQINRLAFSGVSNPVAVREEAFVALQRLLLRIIQRTAAAVSHP